MFPSQRSVLIAWQRLSLESLQTLVAKSTFSPPSTVNRWERAIKCFQRSSLHNNNSWIITAPWISALPPLCRGLLQNYGETGANTGKPTRWCKHHLVFIRLRPPVTAGNPACSTQLGLCNDGVHNLKSTAEQIPVNFTFNDGSPFFKFILLQTKQVWSVS